jgi:hypothetical protein
MAAPTPQISLPFLPLSQNPQTHLFLSSKTIFTSPIQPINPQNPFLRFFKMGVYDDAFDNGFNF